VELFVDLRRDAGGPFRRRLERQIREAVQAGRLLPGAALPSTRALAAQLGVSRGLVVETYAQLVAEGYLSARQGAGTVVAARAAPPHLSPAAGPARTHASPVPRYDFRTGVPDLSAFPRAAWLAAGARCPTLAWATATRGGRSSCVRRSRPTSAASAAASRTPSGCSSAAARVTA
jgi:GntR family transcriptional regulator/MocR family aminotransferase